MNKYRVIRNKVYLDSDIIRTEKLNPKILEIFDPRIFVEYKEVRTNKQNAYYWRRLEEIAQQATMQGRKFNSFAWHIYCKMEIMPIEFEDKKGNIITKYVQLPNGETTLKSTTVMSKKAFADYITAVEAFGAGLGVRFSADGY